MGNAYVVGTFDTKSAELRYVAGLIEAKGISVVTVDVGTTGETSDADITPAQVAEYHSQGASAVFTGDRGSAVGGMATALREFLPRQHVDGVIGLGGSGGTAMVAAAMRELPVGVPKMIVSTVASGDVSAYVDATDIAMFPSVTDVAGLNRISRRVLANAAHALAGAVLDPAREGEGKHAIALSMFGVTTPCVSALASRLEARYDPLVFHATGTGGRAMEKLVDDGLIETVLDVTTTEVCDLIAGGVMSAGEQRLGAIARTGVPYVGSCGALDMVNFGARDTVPERYRDRNLYEHNSQVTLMRTTQEECRRIGEFIAAKLNECPGPVRFLIPEGGVSMLDAPGQPFHDPEADAVLFDTLRRQVRQSADRQVVSVPHHINDPAFVEELLAAFQEISVPRA